MRYLNLHKLALANNENTPEPEMEEVDEGKPPSTSTKEPWGEFRQGTQNVLRQVLENYRATAKLDKQYVAARFNTQDYESRTPSLQKSAAASDIASPMTLAERARKLL